MAKTSFAKKLKKTRIGAAAAWLARPYKHYKDVKRYLERHLPYEPSRKQIRWCFWDFFWFQLRYRGDLDIDYFGAQIYRKSDFVRRDSLAHSVRHGWRDAVQDETYWETFTDKRAFYAAFSEYLGRKWMVADKNTSWDTFCDFVEECNYEVFSKAPKGMGGKGVTLCRLDSEDKRRKLFERCRKKSMILEGKLTQCDELRSFSNGSVNTLRFITLVDWRGEVHIARSELRMGRDGMDVDNFSSGGLVAQVDVDSGVIYSMGRDGNGHEHIFHPDSGRQIVGYRIPDWEGYKTFVRMLAGKYPSMRYVGWDILKDKNGNFCVIEGNKDAGVGGLECGLLYGLRPYYDALLNGDTSFPHHQ